MPVAPNWLERLTFLTFNQGPGPSLDMWGGPAFHVVLTAIWLKLFETLNGQSLTTIGLSQRLETDPRATRILLDTLVSLKYVKQQNSAESKRPSPPAGNWLFWSNCPESRPCG